ncbi:MAG TPA: hypothetical protein VLX61_01070 [Anaerolineales bacterium]|nr:hypothetical protein [Anaerolineales bacterium]
MMLRSIFGSDSRERILTFLVNSQAGCASGLARLSGLDLFAVQKTAQRVRAESILQSRPVGRMRTDAAQPLARAMANG